jgi:GDSL-like Lipase/Acylhydrolase family
MFINKLYGSTTWLGGVFLLVGCFSSQQLPTSGSCLPVSGSLAPSSICGVTASPSASSSTSPSSNTPPPGGSASAPPGGSASAPPGGSASVPPSSNPGSAPLEYVAAGASYTYGTGATGGGSNPSTWVSTSPSSLLNNGYAQTFAIQLATQRAPATLQYDQLAAPGASSSGLTGILANFSTIAAAAHARGAKLLVTVADVGSNDITSNEGPTPGQPFIGAGGDVRQGQFYQRYLAALQTIASGAPDGVIGIGTIDMSKVPANVGIDPTVKAAMSQNAQYVNTGIQDALADSHISHTAFADLFAYYAANSQSYASSNFSGDGVHPNDQGYAIMEQVLVSTYTTAFPGF